jgi:hypothetical protein
VDFSDDLVEPEDLIALKTLHHASRYISAQWENSFDRPSAKANLEARAIIFNASNQIFMEYGAGISRAEVEGAHIIEKNLR